MYVDSDAVTFHPEMFTHSAQVNTQRMSHSEYVYHTEKK